MNAACTLLNPIVKQGQDPSIWYANGLYYLVQSENGGSQIALRAASTLGGLSTGHHVQIWTPPSGTNYSHNIWGPEIEYLNGMWIIYFAADDGNNENHRIYAITANSSDPLGSWSFFGKVQDPTDEWAIDPTVFYYNGNWYMLWSGTPPRPHEGGWRPWPQQIYIAHMSDPLHVDEPYRKLIANPDQTWETSVQAIEEGPEVFIGPNNKLTIVYSANASWSYRYNLGALIYNGGDMGYYGSYTKVGPIFSSGGGVYGPGHLSLPVPGANGGYWMVYHAKTVPTDGWDDRAIFAQPHSWKGDGTPDFGDPGIAKGYTLFDESTNQACQQQHIFYRGNDGGIYHVWWSPGPTPTDPGSFDHDKWSGPGGRARINGAAAPAAAGDPVTMVYYSQQHIFYRGNDGGIYHVWWGPGVSVSPTDPLPSDQWSGPGVGSDRSAQVAAGDPVTMVSE